MQQKIGSVEFGFNEMTLTVRRGWAHTLFLFGIIVAGITFQLFSWDSGDIGEEPQFCRPGILPGFPGSNKYFPDHKIK